MRISNSPSHSLGKDKRAQESIRILFPLSNAPTKLKTWLFMVNGHKSFGSRPVEYSFLVLWLHCGGLPPEPLLFFQLMGKLDGAGRG